MKKVVITPEVATVLSRSTVEGNIVRLPEGQLDRSLYTAVDKVLKALGGKWHTGKRGHVFAAGIGDELAQALDAGHVVDLKKTHEQFFTPAALAAEMAEMLDIQDGDHVLEPSAGDGVLAKVALDRLANVTAIEIDPRHMEWLLQAGANRTRIYRVVIADFMQWTPGALLPFERFVNKVIMNPPFSNGQDVEHVRRAFEFLRPGGKLVAIMSPHPFFASDRRSVEFREWLQKLGGGFRSLPAGTFKESGTMVGSYLVSVTKREPSHA